MNNYIKIGTLNIKNSNVNRSKENTENVLILSSYLMKEKYDILGTQELTNGFSSELRKNLSGYSFLGSYRFNKIISKIKFLKDYNESNNIITNKNIVFSKTKHLPWIPLKLKDLILSIRQTVLIPRIITIIIIKIDNEKICFINTHLSTRIMSVQKRQLKYIEKILKKYIEKYPIILTGDFNMGISNENFQEFMKTLNTVGIKRVEINERTHNKFRDAIDHIFISNNFLIREVGTTGNELEKITDHTGIYAIVKLLDK